jgi:uncharacterized protein YbaR (Trm112 family)
MITSDLLEILRCPMDPSRTARLEETPEGLACQRCRLTFPVREGIPCMLVDEATLPAGCPSLGALPCQQTPSALTPEEAPSP